MKKIIFSPINSLFTAAALLACSAPVFAELPTFPLNDEFTISTNETVSSTGANWTQNVMAQTQTDLYTSSTYEAGVSCDLLDPSIWKVGSAGGEQFAGSVAETADNINFLNISHSMPDGINCDGAYSVSDSLVVAGINADISLGTNNWGYRLFSVADGKESISR